MGFAAGLYLIVGLLAKPTQLVSAREQLTSQLKLARYRTELKPWLSYFKNTNELSRTEPITSEFDRVCEL